MLLLYSIMLYQCITIQYNTILVVYINYAVLYCIIFVFNFINCIVLYYIIFVLYCIVLYSY